jgi:hypothetical protein
MRKPFIATLGVFFVLFGVPLHEASAQKLGKVLIRVAAPAEGQFVDVKLEDSVKDLKKRPHKFVIVDAENEADYLIEVISRNEVPVAGRSSEKTVTVTVSYKDGTVWKPGIKVSKGTTIWSVSADNVMGEVEKWAKIRSVK